RDDGSRAGRFATGLGRALCERPGGAILSIVCLDPRPREGVSRNVVGGVGPLTLERPRRPPAAEPEEGLSPWAARRAASPYRGNVGDSTGLVCARGSEEA